MSVLVLISFIKKNNANDLSNKILDIIKKRPKDLSKSKILYNSKKNREKLGKFIFNLLQKF